jgi:hypothetical protein
MTQYFPKTLRTLYRGCRAWTFNGFTNNDAAVSNIERQRNEIRNPGPSVKPPVSQSPGDSIPDFILDTAGVGPTNESTMAAFKLWIGLRA